MRRGATWVCLCVRVAHLMLYLMCVCACYACCVDFFCGNENSCTNVSDSLSSSFFLFPFLFLILFLLLFLLLLFLKNFDDPSNVFCLPDLLTLMLQARHVDNISSVMSDEMLARCEGVYSLLRE